MLSFTDIDSTQTVLDDYFSLKCFSKREELSSRDDKDRTEAMKARV